MTPQGGVVVVQAELADQFCGPHFSQVTRFSHASLPTTKHPHWVVAYTTIPGGCRLIQSPEDALRESGDNDNTSFR